MTSTFTKISGAASVAFALFAFTSSFADDFPPAVPVPILSKLRPTETIFDFGHVGIEYDLFHVFHFVNTSDKPIKFDTAAINCDCSTVMVQDSIANPGDTIAIHLKFNSKNYFGPTSRSLKIVTNEPSSYKVYYTSNVGQWPYFAKPDPIGLFFLPAHQSLPLRVPNPVDATSRLAGIHQQDTLYTVTILKDHAGKDQAIEMSVQPNPHLKKGTFLSSLRLSIMNTDSPDTVHVTVPVKIVRY